MVMYLTCVKTRFVIMLGLKVKICAVPQLIFFLESQKMFQKECRLLLAKHDLIQNTCICMYISLTKAIKRN